MAKLQKFSKLVVSISVVCRKRIEVKKKMKIGHVIGT